VGALDAVDKLTIKLQFGRYGRVVEADIQGFFDNIDHDRLLAMWAERMDDQALLRLIGKWLKAGVLDTNGGDPSGGGNASRRIVSLHLSQHYLHYCRDGGSSLG
jgi:retron-type reverse transcriptase